MSSIFTESKVTPAVEKRIREWIDALVSGEYSQGNGKLAVLNLNQETQEYDKKSYCCLGVICQLRDADGWVMADPYSVEGHKLGADSLTRQFGNAYLGKATAQLYRISRGGQKQLAQLNDTGKTFSQIAVFIAEQLGAKLAAQAAK